MNLDVLYGGNGGTAMETAEGKDGQPVSTTDSLTSDPSPTAPLALGAETGSACLPAAAAGTAPAQMAVGATPAADTGSQSRLARDVESAAPWVCLALARGWVWTQRARLGGLGW